MIETRYFFSGSKRYAGVEEDDEDDAPAATKFEGFEDDEEDADEDDEDDLTLTVPLK